MPNKKSKIVSGTLAVLMASVNTLGFVGETNTMDKPYTFHQYTYPMANQTLLRPGGELASTSSCGYFSLGFALMKSESIPKDYNILDLVKTAREHGMQNTSWGHFDWSRLHELNLGLKQSDITSYENVFISQGNWFLNGSKETQKETLKKLMREGKYVIVCVRSPKTEGHYVFLDYIDENGDIRMVDSGFEGSYLSEYDDGEISYAIVLESTEGKMSYDMLNLYEDYDDSSKKDNQKILQKRLEEEKRLIEETNKKIRELAKEIKAKEVLRDVPSMKTKPKTAISEILKK